MIKKLQEYWQKADAPTRKKRLFTLCALCVFIIASVVLFATVGADLVRFVSNGAAFRAWIDSHGFAGKLAYIGIVALQIVVAIIPGEPIELVAGYAFGAWQGLLLAEIGILISSALVFIVIKKWGTRAVEAFIPPEKLESFSFLRNDSRRNAIVFLIFFIPGTPKDVLTYFVGLTDITLTQFLAITLIARIPSIISSTVCGQMLGDKDYLTAGIVFTVTGAVSLLGYFIYNRILSSKEKKKTDG